MIEETNIPPAPSLKKIAFATGAALVVACILLVVVILPAERGIDPLGTGKALGLTDLAKSSEKPPLPAAPAASTTALDGAIAPVLGPPAPKSKFGAPGPQMLHTFLAQPKRYKIDSREIDLEPGEGMEIKYNMKKGAGLIFSWAAEKPLLYEFHGEPDQRPPDTSRGYFESYELVDTAGKTEQHATFLAPSTGIHGWYWENPSSEIVKLKLVSAGFYDWIQESRHEKQKALDPMDPK